MSVDNYLLQLPFRSPPLQGEGLSAVALAKEGQGGDGGRTATFLD
jgi:hypothetical protein